MERMISGGREGWWDRRMARCRGGREADAGAQNAGSGWQGSVSLSTTPWQEAVAR